MGFISVWCKSETAEQYSLIQYMLTDGSVSDSNVGYSIGGVWYWIGIEHANCQKALYLNILHFFLLKIRRQSNPNPKLTHAI